MKNKEVKAMFPLNLQYFADEPEKTDPQGAAEPEAKPEQKKNLDEKPPQGNEEYTVEGLLAELTKAKADQARLKNDYDKLCTSEGNLRKQLRAKQTAEEVAAEAEAEAKQAQEEHTKAVEKELAVMKASNRYLKLGFAEEDAAKMAMDEVNGDMDAWTAGVNSFLANAKKEAYAQAKDDLLKDMPMPVSGNSVEIDFNKKFDDAMSEGDTQSAILALLEQNKAARGAQ